MGGAFSVNLDLVPSLGHLHLADVVYYSLGCIDHGVALVPAAGSIVAVLLLERRTERWLVDRRGPGWPRGLEAGVEMGPVISAESRSRIVDLVGRGEAEGAKVHRAWKTKIPRLIRAMTARRR